MFSKIIFRFFKIEDYIWSRFPVSIKCLGLTNEDETVI